MTPISGSTALQRLLPAAAAPPAAGLLADPASQATPSFASLLQGAIQSTSASEQQAQQAISQALVGNDVSEIEVLSAVKKADLSLRLMLQVRNSLLQAYDEIKQMQF